MVKPYFVYFAELIFAERAKKRENKFRENLYPRKLVPLRYLKKYFSGNKKNKRKQLTLKVTMLVVSTSRIGGLHNLDMRFMVRTENKYKKSILQKTRTLRMTEGLQGNEERFSEFSIRSNRDFMKFWNYLDYSYQS